jgi:serine protease inhibitor
MFLTKSMAVISAVVLSFLTPSISTSRIGRKLFKPHFEFAIDMYRDISSDFDDRNLAFSPYIVNSVLAMLFLGTSSFSASSKQLRQVLHLSNISYVDVHKSFKDIVNNFDDNYYQSMLNMGRGLFFQNGTSISFPYVGALNELYHVKTNSLDFESGDCSLLRDKVNIWMRSVTDKWEKGDLLGKAMQCDAKLLAVGTTYLTNHLLHPFRIVDTFNEGLFFLPDNKRLAIFNCKCKDCQTKSVKVLN